MNKMLWWMPNLRMPEYTQVAVLPGWFMEPNDLDLFHAFMRDHVGAKHPPMVIGCVETSNEEGGRVDFMFIVHEEDASDYAFCTRRLQYGLRWLEDVRGNNPKIYPKDFCAAYPLTW